jgi:hypothetical protein
MSPAQGEGVALERTVGLFADRGEANKLVSSLRPELTQNSPWARRVAALQTMIEDLWEHAKPGR